MNKSNINKSLGHNLKWMYDCYLLQLYLLYYMVVQNYVVTTFHTVFFAYSCIIVQPKVLYLKGIIREWVPLECRHTWDKLWLDLKKKRWYSRGNQFIISMPKPHAQLYFTKRCFRLYTHYNFITEKISSGDNFKTVYYMCMNINNRLLYRIIHT